MGAVLNMRPDLFHAALVGVPFVDVMNTMLDASLPLTVPEYEEWGDPNQAEYFHYMLSYSPYDNLRAGDYPSMLVKTSVRSSGLSWSAIVQTSLSFVIAPPCAAGRNRQSCAGAEAIPLIRLYSTAPAPTTNKIAIAPSKRWK